MLDAGHARGLPYTRFMVKKRFAEMFAIILALQAILYPKCYLLTET